MSLTNAWQVSSANEDNTGSRTGYVLDQEKQDRPPCQRAAHRAQAMNSTVQTAIDGIEIQRVGDKVIISCGDENELNKAIRKFTAEGAEAVSIANWRGRTRFTAIITLKGPSQRGL